MKFTEIPLIDRFNEKFEPVTESGCWIWTAFVNEWGYGSISVNKRMRYAHRISYELKNGKIPDGMLVLHRCDTPCCVNPDHLFLGSNKDNINDMMAKGRHRSGAHTESGNLKKLTKDDAESIRNSGMKTTELADNYRVSRATIRNVRNFRTYKQDKDKGEGE